jgi:hypothetical protein
MGLDFGLVVVLAAVLLFYLRLILVQRQKARRFNQATSESKGNKKTTRTRSMKDYSALSIISPRPQDRLIAALGFITIVLGILLNIKIIPWVWGQPYWYLMVAGGILAFSWVFR